MKSTQTMRMKEQTGTLANRRRSMLLVHNAESPSEENQKICTATQLGCYMMHEPWPNRNVWWFWCGMELGCHLRAQDECL